MTQTTEPIKRAVPDTEAVWDTAGTTNLAAALRRVAGQACYDPLELRR